MKRLQITRASQKKALSNAYTSHVPDKTPLGAEIDPVIKMPKIIDDYETVLSIVLGMWVVGFMVMVLLYTFDIAVGQILAVVFIATVMSPLFFYLAAAYIHDAIIDKAYRNEYKAMYKEKSTEFYIADMKARAMKRGHTPSNEEISDLIRYYTGMKISSKQIAAQQNKKVTQCLQH